MTFDRYIWSGSTIFNPDNIVLSSAGAFSHAFTKTIAQGQFGILEIDFTSALPVFIHGRDWTVSLGYTVNDVTCSVDVTGHYGPVMQSLMPALPVTGPFSIGANAYDPDADGSIRRVQFEVYDPTGTRAHAQVEALAPYCVFGESDGMCLVRQPYQEMWNDGAPIVNGVYTVYIQAQDNDPHNQYSRIARTLIVDAATPTPMPTDTPTPTPSPTYVPHSLRFDGVNDIVSTVNLPVLTEFTIEAWIMRKNDLGRYETVLSDATSNYDQAMFSLYVDGGGQDCGAGDQFAYYQINGNSVQCSGVTAQLDVWYHIAVSRDSAGTRRFFVNGELVSTQANSPETTDSSGLFALGRAGNYKGEYFAGLIDEVRISSFARYTSNFAPPTARLPDNSPGTVALWHLDEGSGQTAFDASGNDRHGTLGFGSGADPADPTWSSGTPINNMSVTNANNSAWSWPISVHRYRSPG